MFLFLQSKDYLTLRVLHLSHSRSHFVFQSRQLRICSCAVVGTFFRTSQFPLWPVWFSSRNIHLKSEVLVILQPSCFKFYIQSYENWFCCRVVASECFLQLPWTKHSITWYSGNHAGSGQYPKTVNPVLQKKYNSSQTGWVINLREASTQPQVTFWYFTSLGTMLSNVCRNRNHRDRIITLMSFSINESCRVVP